MTHTRLAAAAALTLALGGSAWAEGDLAAVETPPLARVLRGGGLPVDVGRETYPAFDAVARSVSVVSGTDLLLPTNSSEGAVQTAAALPRGAMDGTAASVQQAQSTEAHAYAQSVPRHFAAQQQHAGHHRYVAVAAIAAPRS